MGNGAVCGIQGTVKGCGSSADGVMGMVMGMKGTVKGCGSSWDRVIVMKGTSKGCGSSADGVMVIGIHGNCKGHGSWDGIIGM